MSKFTERTEEFRLIECQCGEWETFPADMKRNKSQNFEHVESFDNGAASYRCECGNTVVSTFEEVTFED